MPLSSNLKCILLIFLVCISCSTPPKSDVIPLELVDEKLIEEAQFIVEGILTSFKSDLGAKHLLDTEFMTPKIHGGIMMNQVTYYKAYQAINLILGDLSFLELYKVRKRPYIKRMYYHLKSSKKDIHEVTLIIDVNQDYNLVGYYLYAVDDKELLKDKNLLPKLKMR